jgi:hypothetical protein
VGDWAVALNEKANSMTGPHKKATVPNLVQFAVPMRILSGLAQNEGARLLERGPVELRRNHKKKQGGNGIPEIT